MKRQFVNLLRIDNNEAIRMETHPEFLYHLQSAMLLALQEKGMLNAMQYHHAAEKLKQHRKERAKELLSKGDGR